MKLTVVTAVRNAIAAGNRDALVRCVESVALLKTMHEHLIYDGASTDGTIDLLHELETKTPGLKVVSEQDTGIYNALNKGVRDATGDWFYVLGCDDYICHPAVLDRLVAEVERSNHVEAIVSTVRRQTSSSEEDWFTDTSQLDQIFTDPCVCHQGELLRTSIVRDLGGFDERYAIASDSDMFFKAHLKNVKFRYAFDIFAFFSFGGTAVSNLEQALREHRQSVATVLGLDSLQKRTFVDKNLFLPTVLLAKLSNHSDICIRQSAQRMLKMKFRSQLRFWFHPLVWITRPFRIWIRKTLLVHNFG